MRTFQDTCETRNRLFISALSLCMTVPLRWNSLEHLPNANSYQLMPQGAVREPVSQMLQDLISTFDTLNTWKMFIHQFKGCLILIIVYSYRFVKIYKVKNKGYILLWFHSENKKYEKIKMKTKKYRIGAYNDHNNNNDNKTIKMYIPSPPFPPLQLYIENL